MRRPPFRGLAVVAVTEVEPEPAAVVVSVAVFDTEVIAIAFVGLCRTLDAGEGQQAKSGCAGEREKLRTHGELLFGSGDRGEMSDPIDYNERGARLRLRRRGSVGYKLERSPRPAGTSLRTFSARSAG